jgi:hypothetical protein
MTAAVFCRRKFGHAYLGIGQVPKLFPRRNLISVVQPSVRSRADSVRTNDQAGGVGQQRLVGRVDTRFPEM